MAETIPGGATQRADGTWQDAHGKPLSKEARRAAEKLHAEQAEQKAQADANATLAAAQADPVARAFLGLQQQPKPAPTRKGKSADDEAVIS